MQCKKILFNNHRCQARAQHNKVYCFRHDPNNKAINILASQKGGQNRALQGIYGDSVTLDSPQDVKNFLAKVINAVWSEGVPVQVGSSMGFLSRCWLDAYDASDVTKRLDAIEKRLDIH